MASIAILAGVEPRPPSTPGRIQPQDISSAEALDTRSGAVHPQTRRLMHSSHSVHHLLGTKEQISSGSSRLAEKGNGTSEGERPPAGSPSKTILMSNKGPHVYHKKENGWWNGDKSYYRQQVERLGFRYHQPKTNVPRRAPGQYRAAEGNNDLRNLLAAQPVSHMGPLSYGSGPRQRTHRSKKRVGTQCINKSTWDPSDSSDSPGIKATADHVSKSALLNSDQVRAALVLNPANDETKEGNTDGYKKRLGGMSSHQFDAKIVERENELMRREEYGRSRSRPAMESTLPIAWESGSSWNPEGSESAFRTSNQVMNAGERIGYRNPFENARRLGRNRSVLTSQIVLG